MRPRGSPECLDPPPRGRARPARGASAGAMASFEDLKNEWTMLCQDCTTCWTEQDLQLAAELGKTLLERNKELENCIKLHQCTIDDQAQEIEYMKKHTVALREVNDSRLKIYEQLEVSIQDLERANHRLVLENSNEKKQIKSQCLTIETLEARIEEMQKKYDELNTRYEALLREHQTKNQSSDVSSTQNGRTAPLRDGSTQNRAVSPSWRSSSAEKSGAQQQLATALASDEDTARLRLQLQEARAGRAREQKKASELREQLDASLLENAQLEEQLAVLKAKVQDVKNLQDELNTLEEVRQGHLCGRCLRGTDTRGLDELSMMLDQEEYDEISLADSFAESIRDADATLQDAVATKCRLSKERTNITSFIWKIISCLWNPSSLLCLFSDKLSYLNNNSLVLKFANKLIRPFFFPVLMVKRVLLRKRFFFVNWY